MPNYELCFHKVSVDGSAKANAYEVGDPEISVWGVVYAIDDTEKRALDRAEGLGSGYSERFVDLLTLSGTPIRVTAYVADSDAIDNSLVPYTWYKRFVEGAKQHHLPENYVAILGRKGQ